MQLRAAADVRLRSICQKLQNSQLQTDTLRFDTGCMLQLQLQGGVLSLSGRVLRALRMGVLLSGGRRKSLSPAVAK